MHAPPAATAPPPAAAHKWRHVLLAPAGTQQAPGKPFIKLDTATGPLVLGFTTVSDRDDAVDLLKQSKPAAPLKAATASPGGGDKLLVPSAVQAAALFQEDRDLESVYKSLVVAGILSEQEFWRTRQSQLRDALARAGSGGGGQRSKQRVGLPSAMLADVKPSADGQTEKVHFTLTPQSIQQAGVAACSCIPSQLMQVSPCCPAASTLVRQLAATHLRTLCVQGAATHACRALEVSSCALCPASAHARCALMLLQIFVERPEVHRAYLAHVPRSMDEKAFWTRYFKQQYKRMAQRYAQLPPNSLQGPLCCQKMDPYGTVAGVVAAIHAA
jgi:transcription initiation factor TFIIH subunit 1